MLEASVDPGLFSSIVDRLKTTMAALLVVLWIPTTSLCLLEAAGWVSDADGCATSQSSGSSPCCALASASYKAQENQQLAVPFCLLAIAFLVDVLKLIPARNNSSIGEVGVSPPELSQSWQFSVRAALEPRAPSLGS